MDGLAAAAQDGGVAGLETKHGGVGGDVRAAFVDDADGADGHADLLDPYSVRAVPGVHHLADGIGQRGDLIDAGGHGFDACFIELEAVEHGGGESFIRSRREVFRVRRQQLRRGLADGGGHGAEDRVFLVG